MASLTKITTPDASLSNDPKRWRDKAEEARREVEAMKDLIAQKTMRRVVETYEEMALAAEKKISSKKARQDNAEAPTD